jgi:hypothetical protein
MTTASMASPSNKCRFDDDEDPSSTPPLAPLKQRVVNEVGVVVLPMAQTAVPLVAAEKVVLVPQKTTVVTTGAATVMVRVDAAMTWAAMTARAAAAMMMKTKLCASLSGQLLLGSCGSSAPFVLGRSIIPRPSWCFRL